MFICIASVDSYANVKQRFQILLNSQNILGDAQGLREPFAMTGSGNRTTLGRSSGLFPRVYIIGIVVM